MYYATADDCGCGCGGECEDQLGAYGDQQAFQQQYYTPGFGTSRGGVLAPYSPFTSSPTSPLLQNTSGHWYDGILRAAGDLVGELGEDALDFVKSWLSDRVGREAWDRAPEETKRAFVRSALEEYGVPGGGVLSSPIVWGALAFGAAALVMRPRGRRSR